MRILMFTLCMAVSSAIGAQQTVYDYQGQVMTGLGGPETLTAQMEFFGPVNDPDTTATISMNFHGAYSGLFATDNCVIGACATPGDPLALKINETNGKFVSANLSLANTFGSGGSFYQGDLVIGATGDKLDLNALFGPNLVSVANSMPGAWTQMRAPELNGNGALSALTLLASWLLISLGRRPTMNAPQVARRSS